MAARGLNGAAVLANAVRQLSVSGSPHGQNAANKAQQIAGNFPALGGRIGEALQLAQAAGGAGYHAVSCGWWLGQVRGCCRHGVQDVPNDELRRWVINASDHALALLQSRNTSWNHGTIDHEFGTVAEGVGGLVGVDGLSNYAPIVDKLAAQFAASLR